MRRGIIFLVLILCAGGILGFEAGLYQEFQRLFPSKPSADHACGNQNNSTTCIVVNTLLNYGNKTTVWYNGTKVPGNWNFYNLTIFLAPGQVHVENYTNYNEHLVLSINGVAQNATYYWSLWKFCPSNEAWVYATVGADDIALANHGIYGWYYQEQTGKQYPPIPGANTGTVLDLNSC